MAIPDPAEAQDLVALLRSRQAPMEIRRFAARGVLPLDAADRMRALFAVLRDPDSSIEAAAAATFARIPPDDLADFLRASDVNPVEIDTIASRTDDVIVLERVVRHRNVSDTTLAALARTVTGTAQEALIVNQARLLQNPSLIDALFENPELTADSRRILNELKEEFFEKEAKRREARRRGGEKPVEPESMIEEPQGAVECAGEWGEEPPAGASPSAPEPEVPPGAEELFIRISRMTVPERVKLALTGGREERRFLIGDVSTIVGFAVLRARGLTINEVEGFCSMRHLDHDIFRKIATTRDWIRRPLIALALVRNPKVPLTISLPLIKRLQMRELRNIAKDRNLPEAVRVMARKIYLQRRR
ncbi:MAG TPA: hypothetical protein VGK70_00485 [Thermoanaerobaculia bacterium]